MSLSQLELQVAELRERLDAIELTEVFSFPPDRPFGLLALRRRIRHSELVGTQPTVDDGFAYSPRAHGTFSLAGARYGFHIFLGGRMSIVFPSGSTALFQSVSTRDRG